MQRSIIRSDRRRGRQSWMCQERTFRWDNPYSARSGLPLEFKGSEEFIFLSRHHIAIRIGVFNRQYVERTFHPDVADMRSRCRVGDREGPVIAVILFLPPSIIHFFTRTA